MTKDIKDGVPLPGITEPIYGRIDFINKRVSDSERRLRAIDDLLYRVEQNLQAQAQINNDLNKTIRDLQECNMQLVNRLMRLEAKE